MGDCRIHSASATHTSRGNSGKALMALGSRSPSCIPCPRPILQNCRSHHRHKDHPITHHHGHGPCKCMFFWRYLATHIPEEDLSLLGYFCLHPRPLGVFSHRVTVTGSEGTKLLSTRVSQAGQIMLRRRVKPRSLTNCYMPRTNSRATWAWTVLCCPSLPCSPGLNRTEVRNTTLSGTFCGPRSTPRWPSANGSFCHACKTRWKTASTSFGFTAPWSDSSWTWPSHSTIYRSDRLSNSSCAAR